MSRRLLYAALAVALVAAAAVASALPASAALRTVRVRLATGNIVTVTVDAACGPISSIPGLPGTPIEDLTPPSVCGGGTPTVPSVPSVPSVPQPTPPSGGGSGGGGGGGGSHSGGGGSSTHHSSGGSSKPSSGHGQAQQHSGSKTHAQKGNKNSNPQAQNKRSKKHAKAHARPQPTGGTGPGSSSKAPTFFDALPGPGTVTGVPDFVINQFQIPIFLLPIYQAAGIQYGVRWEVLAAINQVETNFGRNLSISSAGAEGWMQFMPSTWQTWGVDANGDGKRDPYNPPDAIFSAARYLKAAGAEKNIRQAIFAYNHANWYVDGVMLRARVFASYPPDFIGSLTGLTEARFPVAARSKYQDAVQKPSATKLKAGANAAQVVDSAPTRRSIDIFAKQGSPVVAANDGVVKKIGFSSSQGHYIVFQDVYGNQYTYSQLGQVQQAYPVPKDTFNPAGAPKTTTAGGKQPQDPTPTSPASAGTQTPPAPAKAQVSKQQQAAPQPANAPVPAPAPPVGYKARLFAHPGRPNARPLGGLQQILDSQTSGSGFTTFDSYFARGVIHLSPKDATLKPLKKGSRVIGGTILGRVGGSGGSKASHLTFQVQPAGKGAPKIDPKPILDGWKLLASTNIYAASGKDALYGHSSSLSIGQVLLLPKPLLQQRVLNDPRVTIYPAGRHDIETGQIDQRVLATLEYLAESGLDPTVTSLKSGHSEMTASGNISEHSTGDAVDIGAINGTPILGNQNPGGITEVTVKRLMQLQGTMAPHQIISLLDFGANTLALPDHYNHIHVGFHPLLGQNAKLGQQTASILKAGQWDKLVSHLDSIDNPTVPTKPSKAALPAPAAGKHSGD